LNSRACSISFGVSGVRTVYRLATEYKSVIAVALLGGALLIAWTHFLSTGVPVSDGMNRVRVIVFGDALARKSRVLAGAGSKDCGTVNTAGEGSGVTECAENSFAGGRPFRVRYDIQGKDSVGSIALVRTASGEMYRLMQDDFSRGTRWDLPVRLDACPKPLALRRTVTHRLTCTTLESTPYR